LEQIVFMFCHKTVVRIIMVLQLANNT
jgi:hypothetical protein